VGVSTDEFNRGKGKETIIPFQDRIEIVRSCRHVDLAIPETRWEQKIEDVLEHGVAVFGMGDDWAGKFDFLKPYCDVVYLPRTQGVSTTDLKECVRRRNPAWAQWHREPLNLTPPSVARA